MRVAAHAALLAAFAGCARSAGPGTGPVDFVPYQFISAAGDTVSAELGHLRVSENRLTPDSRTIELALVRFRSTAEQPGDPIVYLAGGPGGSGIQAARGNRFPAFMALRAAGDVIALDQRGTGRSRPNLACPEKFEHPRHLPLIQDSAARRFHDAAASCAGYWRQRGADLAGYNVESSADDLEALRQALGAPHLVLWGVSYGTHLALATMRRYPSLASRAILAGVVGPDDSWKPRNAFARQLHTAASRVPPDPSSTNPPLDELLREVVTKLDADPVWVPVPHRTPTAERAPGPDSIVISGYDFLGLVMNLLANADQLANIPPLIYRAARGDLHDAGQRIAHNRGAYSIGSAMGYATLCASGASAERRELIAQDAAVSVFGSGLTTGALACDVWGAPDLGEAFRQPVRSDVPTLLISGSLDVTTPAADADAVLAGLSRGQQLVVEGASHGDALIATPTVIGEMVTFLRGGRKTRP